MVYLILIDRKFPYLSGESFLENEIDEISKYFDKILIIPTDIKKKSIQTRKIRSTNVEIILTETKSIKLRRIGYLLEGIKKTFFNYRKNINIKKQLIDNTFIAASETISNHIITTLEKKYNFHKNDKIIFYSYWLYITSQITINLSNYFSHKCITKCVSRAHRFDIYEERRGYLPMQKYLIEATNIIFPCSKDGENYLRNKYPHQKNKIMTSYLGTYDHGTTNIIDNEFINIVSCSRLAPVKRVDLIIDSLKLLKNKNIKMTWTHLGGGELYNHIKKRAYTELSHFMTINLPGMIKNQEVYEYYKHHSVNLFINVSSSEGLPVSIMEAISFGIPCIATNVGGTSEIVINDINGYLLKENFKPQELANYILNLYKDKEKLNSFKLSARKLWEERFQAPINYFNFSQKLLDLIEETKPSSKHNIS